MKITLDDVIAEIRSQIEHLQEDGTKELLREDYIFWKMCILDNILGMLERIDGAKAYAGRMGIQDCLDNCHHPGLRPENSVLQIVQDLIKALDR